MKTVKVKSEVVSCIIPCYNSQQFINECLESIKNQTYKNLELIFIDDGSIDDTYNILLRFKKDNLESFESIKILQHKKNRGICAAFNTALKQIHGEFLCWFDSDDILDKQCVQKKIEFLKSNTQYKCVMARAKVFKDDIGNELGSLGDEKRIGSIFANYLFQYCSTSSGLNMTYTNELLELLPDSGILESITEQNWYLMLLLSAKFEIGFIDDYLYYYRINDNSDSHKNKPKTGKQLKRFWDDVDRIRFRAIEDSKLHYSLKCRYFKLQGENSIADRMFSIDEEQEKHDSGYVYFIVRNFIENGNIEKCINGRDVYIYGTSNRQKQLGKILSKYIKVVGYVDSVLENSKDNIKLISNINKNNSYIIVPLQYHREVIEALNNLGMIDRVDYYYPKAQIYQMVKMESKHNG